MKLSMPEMPPAMMLTALGSYNLLPAILFQPTRRRCDEAASEAAMRRRDVNRERVEARREMLREFALSHPEVRTHRHWDTVIRGGVAAHHAGHIPAWKLAIEQLMSAGLLDAIFATATVAAGVDFPARTVVLSGAERRGGSGWRAFTASELQQMTGRAGRRGRDRVGFIVAAPGLHQDPERIAKLLESKPDPLESQFRATYSTLLNLLDAYGSFAQVRSIAEKSFAYRDTAQKIARLEAEHVAATARIESKLVAGDVVLGVEACLGLERLAAAGSRLHEKLPHTRAEMILRWLDEVVVPGRIVSVGRSGHRLMLVLQRRGAGVFGMREDGRGTSVDLDRVGRVYERVVEIVTDDLGLGAFEDVRSGKNVALVEPKLNNIRASEDESLSILNDAIDRLIPDNQDRARCLELLWSTIDDAAAAHLVELQMETLRREIWQPFERRARVLDRFGYLDFVGEQVTERGKWLADLHVDRPLMVGEAIERGLFDSLDAVRAAALMAALAADEDREYGELALDDSIVTLLARFDEIAYDVSTEEWNHGIEPAPEINFSAAATVALWVSGVEWPALVHATRAEEGDLIRLLSRTGEALMQVAGLKRAKPAAAEIAARAAEAVLREPVR